MEDLMLRKVATIVISLAVSASIAQEAKPADRNSSTMAQLEALQTKINERLAQKKDQELLVNSDKVAEEAISKILDLMAGKIKPEAPAQGASPSDKPPTVESLIQQQLEILDKVAIHSLQPHSQFLKGLESRYPSTPIANQAFRLRVKVIMDVNRRIGKPQPELPAKSTVDSEIDAIRAHFDALKENRSACPAPERVAKWSDILVQAIMAKEKVLTDLKPATNTLISEKRDTMFQVENLNREIEPLRKKAEQPSVEAEFTKKFEKLISDMLVLKATVATNKQSPDKKEITDEAVHQLIREHSFKKIVSNLMVDGRTGLKTIASSITSFTDLARSDWFEGLGQKFDPDTYYILKTTAPSGYSSTINISGVQAFDKVFGPSLTADYFNEKTTLFRDYKGPLHHLPLDIGVSINKVAVDRLSDLEALMSEWEKTEIPASKAKVASLTKSRDDLLSGLKTKTEAHESSVKAAKSSLKDLRKLLSEVRQCRSQIDAMDTNIRAIPADKLTRENIGRVKEQSHEVRQFSDQVTEKVRRYRAE